MKELINILNKDNGKTFLQFNSIIDILQNNDNTNLNDKRVKEIKEKYFSSESVLNSMIEMQKINSKLLQIIENSVK